MSEISKLQTPESWGGKPRCSSRPTHSYFRPDPHNILFSPSVCVLRSKCEPFKIVSVRATLYRLSKLWAPSCPKMNSSTSFG